MKRRQFGLAALLLATTACAVVFAAVRIFQDVIPFTLMVFLVTGTALSIVGLVVISIMGIVNDLRAMPREKRIWQVLLFAIFAVILFVLGIRLG